MNNLQVLSFIGILFIEFGLVFFLIYFNKKLYNREIALPIQFFLYLLLSVPSYYSIEYLILGFFPWQPVLELYTFGALRFYFGVGFSIVISIVVSGLAKSLLREKPLHTTAKPEKNPEKLTYRYHLNNLSAGIFVYLFILSFTGMNISTPLTKSNCQKKVQQHSECKNFKWYKTYRMKGQKKVCHKKIFYKYCPLPTRRPVI